MEEKHMLVLLLARICNETCTDGMIRGTFQSIQHANASPTWCRTIPLRHSYIWSGCESTIVQCPLARSSWCYDDFLPAVMAAMPIFDGVDDAVEYIYNYVMVSSDEEELEFVLADLNSIYTLFALVSCRSLPL